MNQKQAYDNAILCFIDAVVDLHGNIGATDIVAQFHTHRTRASAALKLYKEQQPGNLRFNVSTKRYDKTCTFEKGFLGQRSSLEYLNAIETVFGPAI